MICILFGSNHSPGSYLRVSQIKKHSQGFSGPAVIGRSSVIHEEGGRSFCGRSSFACLSSHGLVDRSDELGTCFCCAPESVFLSLLL